MFMCVQDVVSYGYETTVQKLSSVSIAATAFKGLAKMRRNIEFVSMFVHINNCRGLGDIL